MIITDYEEFKELTSKDDIVSLDIETYGNNPSIKGSKIMGVGLYLPNIKKSIYVPIYNPDLTRYKTDIRLLKYISKEYFTKTKVICHNSMFEYKWFKVVCGIELDIYFDTRYAWYLINPENAKYTGHYGLDEAIETLLEQRSHKAAFNTHLQLKGGSIDNGDHWKADTEVLAEYCAGGDCKSTWDLYEYLRGYIEKYESVRFFQNFLIPYANLLSEQSTIGMNFDSNRAIKYMNNLSKMSDIVEHKIRSLCYEQIEELEYSLTKKKLGDRANQLGLFSNDYVKLNLNSPIQKADLLEKLGISIFETTKEGEVSTSAETLSKYVDKHPVMPLILKHANLNDRLKFTSQYINASKDNTFYLDCDPCATSSGRTAGFKPNFLAINRGDRRLMRCFKAKEGYSFVQFDYSSIEPRLTCHFAKDERLREIILNKYDLYLEYLKDIFPDKADLYDRNDVSGSKKRLKHERDVIKLAILAMNYGAGIARISEHTGTDIETARQIYLGYQKAISKTKDLENRLLKNYTIQGYIRNLFGRPIIMRNTKDILNRFIQSSGHDCLVAFNMILKGLIGDYSKYKPLIIDLHDEFIFEVKDEDIEEFKNHVNNACNILNDRLKLFIPLELSGSVIKDLSQLDK